MVVQVVVRHWTFLNKPTRGCSVTVSIVAMVTNTRTITVMK